MSHVPEPALVKALGLLSPPHRTAVVLRYVDDLTVRQVADSMGRSERAAESLLVRATAALAEAYREVSGE